jgi:hypothetical protein
VRLVCLLRNLQYSLSSAKDDLGGQGLAHISRETKISMRPGRSGSWDPLLEPVIEGRDRKISTSKSINNTQRTISFFFFVS